MSYLKQINHTVHVTPKATFAEMTAHKETRCPSTSVIGLLLPPSISVSQGTDTPSNTVIFFHSVQFVFENKQYVLKFLKHIFQKAEFRILLLLHKRN